MKTINFTKVYNDFGDTLPSDYATFYNNPKNELTPQDLKTVYQINNKHRAYLKLTAEYAEFVAGLKAAKVKKGKDEA